MTHAPSKGCSYKCDQFGGLGYQHVNLEGDINAQTIAVGIQKATVSPSHPGYLCNDVACCILGILNPHLHSFCLNHSGWRRNPPLLLLSIFFLAALFSGVCGCIEGHATCNTAHV